MPKKKVTKAVIPAAGFGTRFLPATKAIPKEMFPIIDKPIIQHVVEDAVASGITDIIIVIGWHKKSIEDHFDSPFELETKLEEAGKIEQLEAVKEVSDLANFIYIRQKGSYGNGTPVLNAKHLIGDEPFVVLWGDDFFDADPPRTKQLIDVYNYYGGSVLSCIETDKEEDTRKYGFVSGDKVNDNIVQVDKIIEKPGPKRVPSKFASVSGQLLTPEIFNVLENLKPGKDNEIWLMDAVAELMTRESVYACLIKNGKYYDTGNKLEYLKANIEYALKRDDLKDELKNYLKNLKL